MNVSGRKGRSPAARWKKSRQRAARAATQRTRPKPGPVTITRPDGSTEIVGGES